MTVDFDQEIDRKGTDAEKWDGRKASFGADDVIPLWVADMDFASPEAVTRALTKRASHPIYGYTLTTERAYEALMQWLNVRHGWSAYRECITLAPGVAPSIYAALHAFTKPGDGVIVQTPVYHHFFESVTALERRLVLNPLRNEGARYLIDFDHLERCAASGARMLIFCSPHNPVGRVWSADELGRLLSICRQHRIIVFVDEIFHNLIYPGHRHIPLMTVAEKDDAVVTAVSPGKTFNISGVGLSALIVSDPEYLVALNRAFGLLHWTVSADTNPFSLTAFETAYREGAAWLDDLMRYLQKTRDRAVAFFAPYASVMTATRPEGTYTLWLDCRGMKLSDAALKQFFIEKAGLGLSPGTGFGAEGSGFMRMNLAMPYAVIDRALNNIGTALKGLSL